MQKEHITYLFISYHFEKFDSRHCINGLPSVRRLAFLAAGQASMLPIIARVIANLENILNWINLLSYKLF